MSDRKVGAKMEDFLYVLKMELEQKLTPDQVDHQLQLYRNYMMDEMSKNKTEEQVLRKLGDPMLICKLIIESYEKQGQKQEREKQRNLTAEEINAQVTNPARGIHAEFQEDKGWDIRLGKLKLNSWYGTFIILGIVLAVFVILSTVFPGLRQP